MHWKQPVAAENLPVHFRSQQFAVFQALADWRAEVHMHAAFIAGDTEGDALIILACHLGVAASVSADKQLAGLGLVAGVVLVADRYWCQAQGIDHLCEWLTLAAHMEHLEDRRIGAVITILGAAFGLSDPDRLAIIADRMIDIGRQQLIGRQLLAPPAD